MNKKSVLIILLILLILGSMCYIFILGNNTHKINNDSNKNSTNLQNKSNDNNISLNHSDNNINNKIDINLIKTYFNPLSNNNHNHGHDKNDSNNSFDEAMEAKLTVERNVHLQKNEIVGYPVYKNHYLDGWLVPIFDKYTKEFLGSIYVCGEIGHHYYIHGPESYSAYKHVISGKYPEIDKHELEIAHEDIIKESDSFKFHVLSAANQEIEDNYPSSNIPLDTQLEEVVELDLNQYYPAESNETA